VTRDGASGFKAEAGRYRLVTAPSCPWAHRTVLMRRLKGLGGDFLLLLRGQRHRCIHTLRASRRPLCGLLSMTKTEVASNLRHPEEAAKLLSRRTQRDCVRPTATLYLPRRASDYGDTRLSE